MAQVASPAPVTLFTGLLLSEQVKLEAVVDLLVVHFGPVQLQTELVPFVTSNYYASEMGETLWRVFVAFDKPIPPDFLAEVKLLTNALEKKLCVAGKRTVNIDPGYVDMAKCVLASAKDFAHRVYLGKGIYAEVTLGWRHGAGFMPQPWTYPDYQSGSACNFFNMLRERGRHNARCKSQAVFSHQS